MSFSVITKDLIRNVVVPSDGYHKALLLSRQQFDQIKTKSKVKSHAEAKSEIDSARKEQINEINAAAQRFEKSNYWKNLHWCTAIRPSWKILKVRFAPQQDQAQKLKVRFAPQ